MTNRNMIDIDPTGLTEDELQQKLFEELADKASIMADQLPLPRGRVGRALISAGSALMLQGVGGVTTADYLESLAADIRAREPATHPRDVN